ncbi:hypothetical protein JOB18_019550 [Solea senegalensis]|uniref:Uncharacterized protein n=1 Tax=Solea senegalensis TaxID=28829 RepID=A0AAV6RCI3_SOLSE|nr:hypothetical protein JOB18_019550 [Solea senegalensis]
MGVGLYRAVMPVAEKLQRSIKTSQTRLLHVHRKPSEVDDAADSLKKCHFLRTQQAILISCITGHGAQYGLERVDVPRPDAGTGSDRQLTNMRLMKPQNAQRFPVATSLTVSVHLITLLFMHTEVVCCYLQPNPPNASNTSSSLQVNDSKCHRQKQALHSDTPSIITPTVITALTEVLAQQLFNDGAALLNETKRAEYEPGRRLLFDGDFHLKIGSNKRLYTDSDQVDFPPEMTFIHTFPSDNLQTSAIVSVSLPTVHLENPRRSARSLKDSGGDHRAGSLLNTPGIKSHSVVQRMYLTVMLDHITDTTNKLTSHQLFEVRKQRCRSCNGQMLMMQDDKLPNPSNEGLTRQSM